jgi:hypothetical protein
MSREHGLHETFTARETRTVFGGDGGTPKYPPARRTGNPKRVKTFAGTDDIYLLILDGVITGIPAFR